MDTDEELEGALSKRGIYLEEAEDDDTVLIGRSGTGPGIRVTKPWDTASRKALYDLLVEHFS